MGDPKRIRRKYEKTKMMWNKERIEHEHEIRDRYGLSTLKELWKATTEVEKIRRNVREVLAGRSTEETGKQIIARLSKYGIVKPGATLDDLLVVSPEAILERRLQSVVFRKGMSKSARQARQLISHGFISVNGRRINAAGYLVAKEEEDAVSYWKPINLDHNTKTGTAEPSKTVAPASGENRTEPKVE
ncbi:MAG: 30S ribosomal protein S4 [Candidatus Marsarchaeota archaeon]|jgi:small subunit ribosomal protein S4|nr:30S ribosomal protein S4 [Candidatus Marsarchaeota archaeon]